MIGTIIPANAKPIVPMFYGTFDNGKTYEVGSVCMVDGEVRIYRGNNTWESLESSKQIYPKICTQCGARLKGSHCEWCGTEYIGAT